MKICGCGATYSPEQWLALPPLGFQLDDDGPIELRNCSSCVTTLAVPALPETVEAVARGGPDRYRASAAATMIEYWQEKARGER